MTRKAQDKRNYDMTTEKAIEIIEENFKYQGIWLHKKGVKKAIEYLIKLTKDIE